MKPSRPLVVGLVVVKVLTVTFGASRAAARECKPSVRDWHGSLNVPPESIAATERGPRQVLGETFVLGQIDKTIIRAALQVLPAKPARLEVVDDSELSPAVSKQVASLDAFVPCGSKTIYLRRRSRTLIEAESQGGPFVLMVALVIWHEMAHVDGLDERDAQGREEALWSDFIRTRPCRCNSGPAPTFAN